MKLGNSKLLYDYFGGGLSLLPPIKNRLNIKAQTSER